MMIITAKEARKLADNAIHDKELENFQQLVNVDIPEKARAGGKSLRIVKKHYGEYNINLLLAAGYQLKPEGDYEHKDGIQVYILSWDEQ